MGTIDGVYLSVPRHATEQRKDWKWHRSDAQTLYHARKRIQLIQECHTQNTHRWYNGAEAAQSVKRIMRERIKDIIVIELLLDKFFGEWLIMLIP